MSENPVPYARRLVTAAAMILPNIAANLPSHHLRRLALRLLGMRIGTGCAIYGGGEVRAPWSINLGNFVSIGHRATLDGRGGLSIGDSVNLSSEVMLWTNQHDYRQDSFPITAAPITIEAHAWLGPRVIVLPGVTIARGCVIGAGAVVTRDTMPFGLYAGVPARRIGERPQNLDYKPGLNHVPII